MENTSATGDNPPNQQQTGPPKQELLDELGKRNLPVRLNTFQIASELANLLHLLLVRNVKIPDARLKLESTLAYVHSHLNDVIPVDESGEPMTKDPSKIREEDRTALTTVRQLVRQCIMAEAMIYEVTDIATEWRKHAHRYDKNSLKLAYAMYDFMTFAAHLNDVYFSQDLTATDIEKAILRRSSVQSIEYELVCAKLVAALKTAKAIHESKTNFRIEVGNPAYIPDIAKNQLSIWYDKNVVIKPLNPEFQEKCGRHVEFEKVMLWYLRSTQRITQKGQQQSNIKVKAIVDKWFKIKLNQDGEEMGNDRMWSGCNIAKN